MGRLIRYLLLVGALLVGSVAHSQAQGWPKRLHFEGFAKVSHISTSGMNLWVTMDNNTVWRYVVKRCEVDIAIEGKHIATISLRDRVVIPRKQRGDILLPLRFEARSSFALGRLLWRILDGEADKITLSYRMRAGVPIISRNFEQSDIPLSDIIDTRIGVMEAIEELWRLVK
jgi:hypothetical protein